MTGQVCRSLRSAAAMAAAVWCMAGGTALAVSPHPDWENALAPSGAAGATLRLAAEGEALYGIVIPDAATSVEEKAAADLAQWLGAMSGATFGVHRASDAEAPQEAFISIGRTQALAASGLPEASATFPEEGFAIAEKDGALYITGGAGRGVINGVYALLEEDLGCRWYSRFSETIPARDPLELTVVARTDAPALRIRDPFLWEAFDGTWSLRNRTNAPDARVPEEWGGHQSYALFVHTFATLVPPEEYFEEHPEYFSEIDGERTPNQLCVSHPESLRIAAESVKRILGAHPEARIISVSQNDSHPCCACELCRAVAEEEGSLAGPLLRFVNAVAEQTAEAFPDVTISTLAYLDTADPPRTVRPRENVAIRLCTDSHAWAEPFLTIEETERFQKRMKGWAAIGARIHIWDYVSNFSHYLGPMPNWQVVADSIRFFAAHNADGVMLQGNYQTPGTADGHMRSWVWGKLLWDPDRDVRALMRDFVFGYYGEAAAPMQRFYALQWDLWEAERHGVLQSPPGGIRFPMTIFPERFMEASRACLAEANALAAGEETQHRVEEAELQLLYADIERMAAAGVGDDAEAFTAALDRFERIARRIGVTHTQEGPANFDAWLGRMREAAQGGG